MVMQGSFIYKGIPVQQNEKSLEVIKDFITKENFDIVIEIGTSYGGLSLFLHEVCSEIGCHFETYDISTERSSMYPNDHVKISIVVGDVFSDDIKRRIKEHLASDKKCLLMCDGGNKVNEFNYFSKFVKVGDFIMAHDYAPNRQDFKDFFENKIWNWMEIQDSELDRGFQYVKKSDWYEEFKNVAWLCCVKE
jgi:cephalosporin hydroxylase